MTAHHTKIEVLTGPELARDDDGWEHYAYTVRLTRDDKTMDVPWRQGLALTDEPTAGAVMESLSSDAATIERADSFEEWADDLGYDPDSRKAEGIYRAVEELTDRLRDFLGDDFSTIIYDPEYWEDSAATVEP